MKFITLVTLILISNSSLCADADTDTVQKSAGEQKECVVVNYKKTLDLTLPEATRTISGTGLMQTCQKIIKTGWKNLIGSTQSILNIEAEFKDANDYYAFKSAKKEMKEMYQRKVSEINNHAKCSDKVPMMDEAIREMAVVMSKHRQDLLQCLALAVMSRQTGAIDIQDSDHTTKDQTTSSDGKIKCSTAGAETLDYPSCKKFANTYTGFLVGQQGVETVQQVSFASKNLDRQQDLLKSTSGTVKKSLEAQRDSLGDQKSIADQRAAFQGAKGAALMAIYKQMPSAGEAIAQCDSPLEQLKAEINKAAETSFQEFISGITTENPSERDRLNINNSVTSKLELINADFKPCEMVVNNAEVFPNQKAKQEMVGMMMKAGLDMTAALGQAAILNKQEGMLGDSINQLNQFSASVTVPTIATASSTSDYCALFPADSICLALNTTTYRDLNTGGGISIAGGQTQTTGDYGVNNAAPVDTSNSGTPVLNRDNNVPSLEPANTDVVKSNALETTVGAAGLKDAAGGGGGGGGGGPGSVAAPNSGGGGGGAGGGSGGSSNTPVKAAYSGSTGGHTYSGGALGAKKKGAEINPLDGLFGNKAAAKGSGDILDFRGIASINDKEKDIFKLISGRYETVNKSKRLIEYEEAPKK